MAESRNTSPARAWVRLPSGRRLDLLAPTPLDWTDDDLATGLARTFEDGNVRCLSRAIKDRLATAAREVDLDRLPTITRPAQHGGRDAGPIG